MGSQSLESFQEICRKICLNIPPGYQWQWDRERNMAVMILASDDAEMVFYPLFKEFQSHWNFTSIHEAAREVTEFVHTQFGLMPGQALFTSHMVDNLVLGVAWWPWGRDEKVSMRVGLIPVGVEMEVAFVRRCLSQWLHIVADSDAPPEQEIQNARN